MRLIYIDKYDCLDSSISDAQVGGRKGKSVQNHIWVLNGVICDVLSTKKKVPVDLQIFDYKQCFDSLWLEEFMNDIYTGGIPFCQSAMSLWVSMGFVDGFLSR